MTTPPPSGLVRFGPVLVLSGPVLRVTLTALQLAARARRMNGLPETALHQALGDAVTAALAADGQSDVPEPTAVQRIPRVAPTVTIEEAARQLGLSRRQTRRLAPELGGQIIAGRWLLDDETVRERREWRNTG